MSSEAGIPKLCDTSVLVIGGTSTDIFPSSLPYDRLEKPIPVPGHHTSFYYFTCGDSVIRLNGPGFWLRPRTGLIGKGFKDLRASLRHHTSD